MANVSRGFQVSLGDTSPLAGNDVGSGAVGSKSASFAWSVTFSPMEMWGASWLCFSG